MNILNFTTLQIENATTYRKIEIPLRLNGALDFKYTDFMEILDRDIRNELEKLELDNIKEPIIFQIKTDLPRIELSPLVDLLVSTFARNYVDNKTDLKHKERILGLPQSFKDVRITHISIMDLINFPLIKEEFTIQLFDNKNRMLVDITTK